MPARHTDPATSHEAAQRTDKQRSRETVLNALAFLGASPDHRIVSHVHANHFKGYGPFFTEQRLRTARHELVDEGLVVPCGETRTPFGRRAIVWGLK